MTNRPRLAMRSLRAEDLPHSSGVYALYRDGKPVYVGVAERQSLRERIWRNHRGRGVSMTSSALRRNVAEHLGIARAVDIKMRLYQPSPADAARVVGWIDDGEIAWIACRSPREAHALERDMKSEWMPLLTKR